MNMRERTTSMASEVLALKHQFVVAGVFSIVAKTEKTALVPFFLKGVADGPDPLALFQGDRIHPNEQAQPIMRDTVWPELRKLVAAR